MIKINKIAFTPSQINQMTLKNRIIMTAMHLGYEYEKEKAFYVERAKGGTAAITTVMGVNPEGTYKNMLLAGDESSGKLLDLAKTLYDYDCKLIVQLFCAGRNGAKGQMYAEDLEPMAPSCVPSQIYKYPPREMTQQDIDQTVKAFGKAARLCLENNVDAVEVSCSAGYLLSQFLSPITNLRTDQYGGTKEKRMRFPIDVLKEIRNEVGKQYPVILRISGNDMIGGYDVEYMQEFVKSIPSGLIDAVNVTGGWHESSVPQIDAHLPKGGWAILAGQIKKTVDVPVIACNRINDNATIETVLSKGMADFVGCARAHLADANFVNKIRLEQPYVKCVGCNKGCIEPILKMKEVQCVMNPLPVENPPVLAMKKKNILVAGAGPAGLMSAKLLALAGHTVTVCTDEEVAGGQVNLAAIPPGKRDIGAVIDSLLHDLDGLGVEVRLKEPVDKAFLNEHSFEHVIVATGGVPITLNLGDNRNVYTAEQVLTGDEDLISKLLKGKIAIIGGGLIGIETALFLVEQSYVSEEILNLLQQYNQGNEYGKLYSYPDISIIEMQKTVGKELGSTRFLTKKELKLKQVKTITEAIVTSFNERKLWYEKNEMEKVSLDADAVVLALGYKCNGQNLMDTLDELGLPYTVVGNALKPGNVKEAFLTAAEAVNGLNQ